MSDKTDGKAESMEGYVIKLGDLSRYKVGPAKVSFGRIDVDAVQDFTRVCEQTGLIDKLRKE